MRLSKTIYHGHVRRGPIAVVPFVALLLPRRQGCSPGRRSRCSDRRWFAVGRGDIAKTVLRRATRFAGYAAELLEQLAQLQWTVDDAQGARWSLQKIVTDNPERYPAQAALVPLDIDLGSFDNLRREEALKELRAAI